jgi:hypothetical protein
MTSRSRSLSKIIKDNGAITVTSVNGNASTATTLQTARTIGGVSFNGSANINLPGVNTTGNQNTSGSAATLTTGRNFSLTGPVTATAVSFNGSGDVALSTAITAGSVDSAALGSLSVSSAKLQANIPDSKLATISTAGKVSNSATTATNANTASAIVARDASGNFSAGLITTAALDTATAASHYFVETGSDGVIRPKTLSDVRTEVVTTSAVNAAAATTVGTVTSGIWNAGAVTSSGIVSGSELTSTNATGDEGGQINLAKPPNGTIAGGVTIDVWQNRIRFFVQGGAAKGAYIDLPSTADGVGTNLLGASAPGDGTLTLAVSGTGLSGSASFTANQSGNSTFTVTSNATSANTVSTLVARDASGNFSAGTITATLNGNASNVSNGALTSSKFSSATSLIIYNSAGTALKTIYSPGS